ncbi:MAG: tRNA (adenosine(37)-N6)-threonylcarbamoyltransferase complex ATPase subunit type 1 TsaE [Actinobacteria bacterium]|nr:tRNA (adenosine(37)-N6)-threonylcarbamoyltransferase complex ATPase subunit type 1 TsaE [Actinomycetota bacterium]
MFPKVLKSASSNQTQKFAKSLAKFLIPGDIISLTGDLGAGKTCFTQGLASGLGIDLSITSPTFNILKEYQARLPLYHFDAYRIESVNDFFEIGYEEYFFGDGVTVVEWGDKIKSLLSDEYLEIEFKRIDDTTRELLIVPYGARWKNIVEEWLKC